MSDLAAISIVAPLSGVLYPLAQVPDPVFAQGMMGPGWAIDPIDGLLLAPCAGRITQLAATGHALTLTTADGAEILMHIGLDTVQLGGRGFSPQIKVGDAVAVGDLLIRFDLDAVACAAPSLITPVVLANAERFRVVEQAVQTPGQIAAGEALMQLLAQGEGKDEALDGGSRLTADASVRHHGGLHARPSARVRSAAQPHAAKVTLAFGGQQASALSLVALLGLGVREGDTVTVIAEGREAAAALAAVVAVLETADPAEADAAKSADAPATLARASDLGPGQFGGVCAAPGLGCGPLHLWQAARFDVAARPVAAVDAEFADLDRALADALQVLQADLDSARRQRRQTEVDILTAHQALLDDPELIDDARAEIRGGAGAAVAWNQSVEDRATALAAMDNRLLAERAADLRDVGRRVLRALGVPVQAASAVPAGSVVLADDLTPSDLVSLPLSQLAGIALRHGGPTSHVAIIARANAVPMLVALGADARIAAANGSVVIDADHGVLETLPDAARIASVQAQLAERRIQAEQALAASRAAAVTQDGVTIEVAANIADVAGAEAAAAHGADAIGLLRTELLFLDREQAPGRDEQRSVYDAILNAMSPHPVIIRTLDFGGDKPLAYLPLPPEENPALGVRGIRIAGPYPQILATQFDALLDVAEPQRLRIMLPMVTDATEMATLRAQLVAAARARGMDPEKLPQIGAMVEVPSAALLAGQLAEHAQFLSVGTNDLTQYALAMDRGHPGLAAKLDGLHPAVLRLIGEAVRGASPKGVWVGVCGALASDFDATPLLIGLGVSELSVDPKLVPRIKARVRSLSLNECREFVNQALVLPDAAAVRALVRQRYPHA